MVSGVAMPATEAPGGPWGTVSVLSSYWEAAGAASPVEILLATTTTSTSTTSTSSSTTTTTTTTTEAPPPTTAAPRPEAVTPEAYRVASTIEQIVRLAAREFGLPEQKFVDVVWCESKFNPEAKNPSSGALGLGQHLPEYWPSRARAVYGPDVQTPWNDPVVNARVTGWLWRTGGSGHWAECGG